MTLSETIFSIIKQFEGLKLEPYIDYKQWSIGYGTFVGKYPGPKPDLKLTGEHEASELMRADIAKREIEVKRKLKRKLNPNQYGALISFAYNAGVGAASSVITQINEGNLAGATQKMMEYVFAGGKRLDSLVKRRIKEVSIFNTPYNISTVNQQPNFPKMVLSVFLVITVTILIIKWNF